MQKIMEALMMCQRKRDPWKAGSTVAGVLLLLVLMTWVPVSVASAHEEAAGLATPGTIPLQATPTIDTTVTALNKAKLAQEVQQLQQSNDRSWQAWFWSSGATFLSTLVLVGGALIGFWQWRVNRDDIRDKDAKDRQTAQDKELKDRQDEREKRAEERFQAAVEGFGSEREEAKVGAAVLLRTFLRPGYEQFYTQAFDLAVANLRLPRTPTPPEDPDAPLPLTTLSQALIVAFKESFPLARDRTKEKNSHFNAQSLDASDTQLDKANLNSADLEQAWMPGASLREANLFEANLAEANLAEANLAEANLMRAKLNKASLFGANLSGAKLNTAELNETLLFGANLSQANLSESNFSKASLHGADLSGANLGGADLSHADLIQTKFSEACLLGANLSESNLNQADLSNADLSYANLGKVFLADANLSGADLSSARLFDTATSLERADLRGVKGLTKEQLKAYQAKGAIIDEDLTTSSSQSIIAPSSSPQSNDAPASSAPPAQKSIPSSDPDEGTITSS